MTVLSQILKEPQEERTRIHDQLGGLDAAIDALRKVAGGTQGWEEPRQKRTLSLAARKKIADAQRARWAKVRQQEKTVAERKKGPRLPEQLLSGTACPGPWLISSWEESQCFPEIELQNGTIAKVEDAAAGRGVVASPAATRLRLTTGLSSPYSRTGTQQPMIELPPEIEAGILAQAKAEGMPVAEYLQILLRGQVTAADRASAVLPTQAEASERAREINPGRVGESRAYDLSPEEWIKRFEAWVASHSGSPVVLPDAAMERESIYGDHGR